MIANTLMKRLFFVFLAIFISATAFAQSDLDKWASFDFRKKLIQDSDLEGLTEDELGFVRGVVFGKHGRIFKDWQIQEWLEDHKWYKPNKRFSNSMLNDTERKNLDIIREAESDVHD